MAPRLEMLAPPRVARKARGDSDSSLSSGLVTSGVGGGGGGGEPEGELAAEIQHSARPRITSPAASGPRSRSCTALTVSWPSAPAICSLST